MVHTCTAHASPCANCTTPHADLLSQTRLRRPPRYSHQHQHCYSHQHLHFFSSTSTFTYLLKSISQQHTLFPPLTHPADMHRETCPHTHSPPLLHPFSFLLFICSPPFPPHTHTHTTMTLTSPHANAYLLISIPPPHELWLICTTFFFLFFLLNESFDNL